VPAEPRAQLWKALIEMDEAQLKRSSEALGAGKYYQFFPLMFTFQRWGGNSQLGQSMSVDDIHKLKVRRALVCPCASVAKCAWMGGPGLAVHRKR
jgi:hypothetical protein